MNGLDSRAEASLKEKQLYLYTIVSAPAAKFQTALPNRLPYGCWVA